MLFTKEEKKKADALAELYAYEAQRVDCSETGREFQMYQDVRADVDFCIGILNRIFVDGCKFENNTPLVHESTLWGVITDWGSSPTKEAQEVIRDRFDIACLRNAFTVVAIVDSHVYEVFDTEDRRWWFYAAEYAIRQYETCWRFHEAMTVKKFTVAFAPDGSEAWNTVANNVVIK